MNGESDSKTLEKSKKALDNRPKVCYTEGEVKGRADSPKV